jgi:hypothetical protein
MRCTLHEKGKEIVLTLFPRIAQVRVHTTDSARFGGLERNATNCRSGGCDSLKKPAVAFSLESISFL